MPEPSGLFWIAFFCAVAGLLILASWLDERGL